MTNETDAHTQQLDLKGRKAAITGGTTGIGRAIAVLLASYGVDVFICGRTPEHLEDALRRIREVGKGDGINLDLAEPDASRKFIEAAKTYLGGLDIVVVNAAIPIEGFSDLSEDELRYSIAVDFTGYLLTAHAAADAMTAGSDIVLIGSMSAYNLDASSPTYAGIKYGIQGFAQGIRKELAPKDIKVSLIEPGKTGADFQYPEFPPEKQREAINKDEMLRAEDIAVGVHYVLTQPRRAVIQQLTIAPRQQPSE